MKHALAIRVGPVAFRIGSAWPGPVAELRSLYRDYPEPEDGFCDFTVRLEPEGRLRRWIRPSVSIRGDYVLPGATPLSLAHGLLAAEMGMNLQMAFGQKRFLLLHASTVEKDGRALIMTGESGAGKSTLAALLGERGWRLMGDEFALLDLESGQLMPFPRAVSLKNEAITVMESEVAPDRLGPRLAGTPKGDIRHLRPNRVALDHMDVPARPALILFPRFGQKAALRSVGQAEVFMRLTQASTNYVSLGQPAFDSLTRLVVRHPALAIDYPDTEAALAQVDMLWQAQAA